MPADSLSNTQTIGREADISELDRILEEVKESKGRFVFITGEAGVGKSRLIRELEGRHWEDDLIILRGRCQYMDRADPYYPIYEMLRQAKDLLPPEGGPQTELLPLALSATKDDAPRTTPLHMGLILAGGDEPQENVSDRMASVFLELATRGVVVLVIENLQWADRATLDFIGKLGDEISERPIMVIATYEYDELPASDSPLIETVKRLRSKGLASFIKVKRLTKAQARAFISEVLGTETVPDQVVDALFERTMGNPYLIKEAMAQIPEISQRSKDPFWYTKIDLRKIRMPASLGDVMALRMKRMSEEDRKALSYASVLGTRFYLGDLADLMGQPQEALLPRIRTLADMRLLRLDTSARTPAYLFENPLVKELAYGSLTKSRRRVLHSRMGDIMEAKNASDPSKVLFDLAYHFSLGRSDDKALKYLVLAGERSMEMRATQDAIGYFTQAEEVLKLGPASAKAQNIIGNLYFDLGWTKDSIGEWQKAAEYYNKALSVARSQNSLKEQARIFTGLAQISKRRGMWDSAEADYLKAVDAMKGTSEYGMLAETYRQLGEVTLRHGDVAKALPYLEESIRYAKLSRSPETLGIVLIQIGNLYNFKGDLDRSLDHYERGLDLLMQTQNRDWQIVAYGNIGDIYLQRQDWGKALDYFGHAQRTAIKTGNTHRLGFALMNIAEAMAKKGDLPQALASGEESLALLRRVDDRIGIASALKNLGLICAQSNELGRSQRYFIESIEMLRSLGTPYNLAQALAEYSQTLERMGAVPEAMSNLEEALRLFESIGSTGPTNDVRKRLKRLAGPRRTAKSK